MIEDITSFLSRNGALVRRTSYMASALTAFLLYLALVGPVVAEAGVGAPDLPPPWMIQPDAYMGLPSLGMESDDWLGLDIGFLLLGVAFLGMVAFNVVMWQQVRRVHLVAKHGAGARGRDGRGS